METPNEIKEEGITIDDLAIMVQKGFMGVSKEIQDLRVELKAEIRGVHTELKAEI